MVPPAWTPDQPLVRLRDVHKTFGANLVLGGVTFDVMKGDVICIIGPSGAGKSTLLRCINALVPIDRGSILVEGQEVNDPTLDKLALRQGRHGVPAVQSVSASHGARQHHDGAASRAQARAR
jgi:polar amino acid transport system ATP-binding protein